VNPWNISELAEAIHQALTLPEEKKIEMNKYCTQHVMTHTAQAWAKSFTDKLREIG
jgi:trehalose 6-phosphate synthase/phosphatase